MSVEMFKIISLVGYILAGFMFIVSALLFFKLDIPKVYGDITGITARKAIEEIRRRNTETGEKVYKPSPVNLARGKITDKISPSGNIIKNPSNNIGINIITDKIDTFELDEETTVLDNSDETTLLIQNSEFDATTVLDEEVKDDHGSEGGFEILVDITYIHTQENIE